MASEDTRERLLNAAEQRFAEHGISGTTLRALTKVAKVNLAAVHYHFGSKEGLLFAVVDRVFGFDEVAAAHVYLESNASFGKVVVQVV